MGGCAAPCGQPPTGQSSAPKPICAALESIACYVSARPLALMRLMFYQAHLDAL